MLDGKKILITGGTGSLGQALTSRLLKEDVDTIRIFSRNENKQITMESKFEDDRLRFLLGDVRDYSGLVRAMEDIDIVFQLCIFLEQNSKTSVIKRFSHKALS